MQAAHPDYWKAENLDYFNGYSWVQAPVAQPQHPLDESAAAVRLYTQTIKVTIRGLDTTDVIAAGSALAPQDISAQVLPGASPGTWTTASTVQPGASYRVNVYAPAAIAGLYGPSATSLAAVGPALDPDLSAYLTVGMPSAVVAGAGVVRAAPVVFAPFHSRRPVASDATDGDVTTIRLMTPTRVQGTPYAQAFALAQRLARQAATPYAFVQSVLRYLSTANGFSYNQHPPSSRYPLESFLFDTKTGYCQQFSGAMALLLRMGGVPARVGAGFTTGTYDSAIKQYVVSDTDAHDWVEAWFAGYGWVAFDPTPAAAPARGGHAPLPAIEGADTSVGAAPLIHHQDVTPSAGTAARAARPHRSSSVVTVVALAVAAALVLVALAALAWRRAAASPRDPLGELERALARCGRPVADGVTLAALERRFGSSGDGAAYIRAIRLARFADGEQPTPEQRRALRAQLRAGLGVTGTLRALWALPPRWRRRIGSGSQSRGIH
ncbi:MAG: transglutaminase-like domain-containing protein [Solirubrobacteraceae bacterium]